MWHQIETSDRGTEILSNRFIFQNVMLCRTRAYTKLVFKRQLGDYLPQSIISQNEYAFKLRTVIEGKTSYEKQTQFPEKNIVQDCGLSKLDKKGSYMLTCHRAL
jgi:hypothetical protein